MFRPPSLVVLLTVVTVWLLSVSKLLDLPVIFLVYIALDYNQLMLLDFLPMSVKYLRRVHDLVERLWILITNKRYLDSNPDLVINYICDIKANCLNFSASISLFVIRT